LDFSKKAGEGRFLRACRRKRVDCTPVWIMRQAGRYLPEYRRLRAKLSFLEMCRRPEIAAEVTLQPLKRFDLDAAIIFSDILLPIQAIGVGLVFTKNDGPVIRKPVRSRAQAMRIRCFSPEEELHYVFEAIRLVRKELDEKIPLIGFSGAPFTLASYLVEGGHSRNFEKTKGMMYGEPLAWHKMMEVLTNGLASYLRAQVKAGAQALQVFDSWVGCLCPEDYRKFVFPHSKALMDKLKHLGSPVVHFGTGTSELLPLMKEAGGDVIGVDWRIPLDEAWRKIGFSKAIQGNLDPVVLLGTQKDIRKKVRSILKKAAGRSGHIFNLGHGIFPSTPIRNVEFLVDAVHRLSRVSAGHG